MKRNEPTTQPISIEGLQRLMSALCNALANARLQSRYISVVLAEHHLQQVPSQLAIFLFGIAGEVDAILSLCESRLLEASSKSESDISREREGVASGIEALTNRSRKKRSKRLSIIDELEELAKRKGERRRE